MHLLLLQGDVHEKKEIVQDMTLHELCPFCCCRAMCTRRRKSCRT